MKCLILAGGRGERLWPLSRVNFPKQFINVQKNHSIFQETVARNMAFCDEFIIVTNSAYRPIIANQMEAFQGVSYRCVFEEEPRKTLPAIALGCRGLQPSEFVFVVAADHLVDTGDCEGLNYKDAILKAKELAREGKIALFGNIDAHARGVSVALQDLLVDQFAVDGHQILFDVAVVLDHQPRVDHAHHG